MRSSEHERNVGYAKGDGEEESDDLINGMVGCCGCEVGLEAEYNYVTNKAK